MGACTSSEKEVVETDGRQLNPGCSRTAETSSEPRGALDPAGLTHGQRIVCAGEEGTREVAKGFLARASEGDERPRTKKG